MPLSFHGRTGRPFRLPGASPDPGVRAFRGFVVAHLTSLLGTSMASVAVAFAVLATGGGGTALGAVMAARILPLTALLLVGGAVADRLGGRAVMLAADLLRCGAQAAFALLLVTGADALPGLLAVSVLGGVGEGLFTPALAALVPRLVPAGRLVGANLALQGARSSATVAGPVLAGLFTAVSGPAAVLVLDAATYAVSVLVLLRLPARAPAPGRSPSLARDLREGWSLFRSQTWLWATTAHVCLMNLLVWGPFLVLGPVLAEAGAGAGGDGAGAWGVVMGVYGAGAAVGALPLLRRPPTRPLRLAALASLGWALPSATLATGADTAWVCVAALVCGACSAVHGTLATATVQQWAPADQQGRLAAFGSLGAFVLGPVGLVLAGPLAETFGVRTVLAAGALWMPLGVAAVLAVPAVRRGTPPAAPTAPAHPTASPGAGAVVPGPVSRAVRPLPQDLQGGTEGDQQGDEGHERGEGRHPQAPTG
ncbi:MFS transporter [Streptomyces sp. NPDC059740]|uniref:MFS transporter n=1 Tax=Streptomyces sp. NPDC059740 TaxID=3346926 RepID=UPI003664AD55